MKFTNNNRNPKAILFFSLVFVFSLVTAYCLTALVRVPDPVQETSAVNRRQLFRNYRLLNYFLASGQQRSLAEVDPADRDNPLLADIERLGLAQRLVDDKKFTAGSELLAKISGQFPFIVARRDELQLRSLYGAKKNKGFVAYFDAHPSNSLEIRLMRLDSLVKNNQPQRARDEFKRLFMNTELSRFSKILPRPTWLAMLNGLDEGDWLAKFSFLLKQGAKAEFRQELPYCRSRSLARLFRAEFAYLGRDYSQARVLLQEGLDEKYRPFAEKILLKIAVRMDPQAGITDRLQALSTNSLIYPGLLLDLAQILAGKGEFARALPLYQQYLQQARNVGGEEYWKTVWLLAWIHYRLDQKQTALAYFRLGSESPFISYRIASRYWQGKLENGRSARLHGYPFSYYAVKAFPDKAQFKNLQQHFISTIDEPPSPRLLEIIADLKVLARYGLWQECAETIRAANSDRRLARSDHNLLQVIESLVYFRQDQFHQAFARFRGNFRAIESVRLPNFLSGIFFPRRYSELIAAYSKEQSVDPCLVHALIREESFYRADIVSPAKAHGLMQLLLGTARDIARNNDRKVKVQDLYDPEINIRLGLEYLKKLLDKYDGRLYLALAAYNAGDHRVDRWLEEFPGASEEEFIEMIPFSETRLYVKNILRNYFFYRYYYESDQK